MTSLALLALSGCVVDDGPDPEPEGPTLEAPWAPTTVPFDPTCADCEQIGSGHLAHLGQVSVVVQPDVDDPVAQWGACLAGFMRCVDGGASPDDCVRGAPCPTPCADEYDRVLAGATDQEAQLAAFATVFVEPGSPCRPEPEVSP